MAVPNYLREFDNLLRRIFSMFKIYLNDNDTMPQDKVYYIIGSNGIFLKKNIGNLEAVVKVSGIPTLKPIKEFAKSNFPKIPAEIFGKVISFFNSIYKKYHSESVVILYYDYETKKYEIDVPQQVVSSAKVEYKIDENKNSFIKVGTIHSHCGFSAFHSGVDIRDEKNFDGIHITIGELGKITAEKQTVSIVSSVVVNGYREKIKPEEIVDGIEKNDNRIKSKIFLDNTFHLDYQYSQNHTTSLYDVKIIPHFEKWENNVSEKKNIFEETQFFNMNDNFDRYFRQPNFQNTYYNKNKKNFLILEKPMCLDCIFYDIPEGTKNNFVPDEDFVFFYKGNDKCYYCKFYDDNFRSNK